MVNLHIIAKLAIFMEFCTSLFKILFMMNAVDYGLFLIAQCENTIPLLSVPRGKKNFTWLTIRALQYEHQILCLKMEAKTYRGLFKII